MMTEEKLQDGINEIEEIITLHGKPLIDALETAVTVENGVDLLANIDEALQCAKNIVTCLIELRLEVR